MYKLCVFVPESHLQAVKDALFEAGAGKIGNYENCCWQTRGQGQFKPLEKSRPYIGQSGQLEKVEEYKVELVVRDEIIKAVITNMKRAHPYEEPAFDIWQLASI
ncbi:hypothetical protein MNBD_GAMMA08-754 [hydrothermal vent metagenome]|uniref:Bsu YqfO NIF3/CutA domain n=1 Tax=hydrothermal vent metagenome TaxID=652676 RepID=A0A3B0XQS6_9ZZZZ